VRKERKEAVAADAVKVDEVEEVHVVDEEDVVVKADAHLIWILSLMNLKRKSASSAKRRKLRLSQLNLKNQMINQLPNRLLVISLVKMLMLLRSRKDES
jgi:hypothetical protein